MSEQKPGRALAAEWVDLEREPQNPPDPRYPNGVDVDVSRGQTPCCRIELAYPTARCGYWDVTCRLCGIQAKITTAGRPDDPRSLTVACKTEVKR